MLQDGNVYTLYLDKYSTESCLITVALNKADEFDEIVLTTKETYNVKISYGTCFIQMPDGSEESIRLSGDSNGRLIVDDIYKTFDITAEELLEIEKSTAYEDPYDIAGVAAAFYNINNYSFYSDENFHMRIIGFLFGIFIIAIGVYAVKNPESSAEKNNSSPEMMVFRGYFSVIAGIAFLIFALLVGY